jgi:tetratricopeptide (TPR) repeat protein
VSLIKIEVNMILNKQKIKFFFSSIVILSFLFGDFTQKAQDLVPSADLSLGASVFVFRKSRTNPQSKSTSRQYFLRNSSGRTSASRQWFRNNTAVSYKRKSSKSGSNLTAQNQNKARNAAATRNKLSETLTAKADALLENKQTDTAIETYKNALKNNPQNTNAKLGLSEAYIIKGDETLQANGREEAKSFYQEAVKADDSNYASFAKLGQLLEDMKLRDDALVNYEKALKINPSAAELYTPVANIYYQKDDYALAETYLTKAETNSANNAETVFLRGLLHFKRNENEKALAAFDKAVSLDSNLIEAFLYQAEVYDRLNKDKEAIAAYRKTVELDPKFIEAWFDLAVANYNQGNYAEAETAYKKVIDLDASHPEAHANLASVYRQMEKYPEANSEYKIAAEYIKDDADLFSEWGYCLGKVNEWDKSIDRLQTAKDLSPDSIDYTNLGWGYYNAAQKDIEGQKKAEGQSKLAQGKEALQKAVELNPTFDAAYLNLGITYTGLGEYQNAVDTLTKANNLHKNWVMAINELGVAYRKLNNLAEAINQFQKVINLDEKFALGYFNLGEAQNKLGRKAEAKKTLTKLKQLNPGMAKKLDDVIEGRIIDETKQQIKKRIPRLPF